MCNINVRDRKGAILRFLWIVCVEMRHVDGRLFGIFPMSCLWIVCFFTRSLALSKSYRNIRTTTATGRTTKRRAICIAKCVSRRNVIFVKFGRIHARIEFNQVVTITTPATAWHSKTHTRPIELSGWEIEEYAHHKTVNSLTILSFNWYGTMKSKRRRNHLIVNYNEIGI